ncbi:recombination-associated protein RdgC [Desulfatiglans anilini]|uniref:recombination-associated protein RdgC n=1 Tax=Desulfatiglans anilini TaxID=90728 RepID=UPI00041E91F0|nr:recombination-associated protein RdgC [Desulfatiglans anilini]
MGFIQGSASFTRYWVEGTVPREVMESLPPRVGRYAFRPFADDSDQEKSMGWVNIMDLFDNVMGGLDYLKEPYLALSLRVDVRRVPASALKQFCREAEEKVKAAEEIAFLPRERRIEIRESVKRSLLHRSIPRTNVYDMVWRLTDGMVFFGAVNAALCDDFAALFYQTFGLTLQAVYPYALAARILEREKRSLGALDALTPCLFTGGRQPSD